MSDDPRVACGDVIMVNINRAALEHLIEEGEVSIGYRSDKRVYIQLRDDISGGDDLAHRGLE